MAKRKMLGNIRFVGQCQYFVYVDVPVLNVLVLTSCYYVIIGELFKIGVLHEAIIHSCIKEVGLSLFCYHLNQFLLLGPGVVYSIYLCVFLLPVSEFK